MQHPFLVIAILVGLGFAAFIHVPTYTTGTAVVMFEGSTSLTATIGGTVAKVFVKENEAVKKGDPLIRLSSPEEQAALTAAETEWHDQQIQFLFDQTNEQARKSMKQAATNREHQLARVEARTIHAPRDGVVTNLYVKEGVAVSAGGYVMQITDEDSEIEVLAFLPSKDSPRIREKMGLQLALDGYTKSRVTGTITHVQSDAVPSTRTSSLLGVFLGLVLTALVTTVTPAAAGGKLANGVKYDASWECESGDCSSSGVCRGKDGKLANGVKCDASWECESGDCSSGVCQSR